MSQEPELTTAELYFAVTNGRFGTDWQVQQAVRAHIHKHHSGLTADESALEEFKHRYSIAVGRLQLSFELGTD